MVFCNQAFGGVLEAGQAGKTHGIFSAFDMDLGAGIGGRDGFGDTGRQAISAQDICFLDVAASRAVTGLGITAGLGSEVLDGGGVSINDGSLGGGVAGGVSIAATEFGGAVGVDIVNSFSKGLSGSAFGVGTAGSLKIVFEVHSV